MLLVFYGISDALNLIFECAALHALREECACFSSELLQAIIIELTISSNQNN